MNKKIKMVATGVIVVASAVIGYERYLKPTDSQLFVDNVEALTESESSNSKIVCYSKSKVKIGYTYYDCGECKKEYDERPLGSPSKCSK